MNVSDIDFSFINNLESTWIHYSNQNFGGEKNTLQNPSYPSKAKRIQIHSLFQREIVPQSKFRCMPGIIQF